MLGDPELGRDLSTPKPRPGCSRAEILVFTWGKVTLAPGDGNDTAVRVLESVEKRRVSASRAQPWRALKRGFFLLIT